MRPLRIIGGGKEIPNEEKDMADHIKRCPHCKRVSGVSATSYAENPYCQLCLDERLKTASEQHGPVERRRVGGMMVLIPTTGIAVSGTPLPAYE